MAYFMGSHQNRLDAKGRVSIPAAFRANLRAMGDGGAGLVLRPSHTFPCIEGWPTPAFEALGAPMNRLDTFSEAADDLATALYAEAVPVEADREGRIVLPDALVQHAKLRDLVLFMGVGRTFQIWEPAAAARRLLEAKDRTRARNYTLPGSP